MGWSNKTTQSKSNKPPILSRGFFISYKHSTDVSVYRHDPPFQVDPNL